MDNRTQVREFLASWRARITPGQAGLATYGGNRRVKGLRREEVALLKTASQIAAGELADPEIRSAKVGRRRRLHPIQVIGAGVSG